jgi:hypothetical protein
MPTTEAIKPKQLQVQATHRMVAINADSNGELPERIQLVKTGQWPDDSNKGFLEINRGDLLEMKANFDAGLSMPEGDKRLAVDFMHADYDKAAIWIGSLEVEDDVLWGAALEYTTSGREAILGGEFARISPSFYPRCRGSWHDPEDWSITADNVIVGAALTNIPFFKGLKSIMASNQTQGGRDEDILFVDKDAKGASMPTLEDVRLKASVAELEDNEKALLVDNLDKLTADEKVKFGFQTVEEPINADDKVAGDKLTDEEQKVLADFRSGNKVVVDATELEGLKASVTTLETSEKKNREEKVEASVKAAVEAGKIKADQAETWNGLIMADPNMEKVMNDLTENKLLADELGADSGAEGSAVAQLEAKAQEKIKASRENGGTEIAYGDAVQAARRENGDLAKAADAEMRGE